VGVGRVEIERRLGHHLLVLGDGTYQAPLNCSAVMCILSSQRYPSHRSRASPPVTGLQP
jgi:hypothetical protein